MIIARQLLKLQNYAKTTPMFRFSTEQTETPLGEQRVQKPRFKKVAIILSGSGVYDGTEVTEAVSLMIHLNKLHVDFQCFAPNTNQMHVVNHITGEATTEVRNTLVEAARIARGQVKDIVELKGDDYQAILLPGGFGVAKNLSDYAVNGASFNVHAEVERALREFHTLKKPIGAMCISPLLLAKVFQNEKPKITMGRIDTQDSQQKYWPHSDAISAAETLGAQHMQRNADKFQIDFDNKLVTIPAMMFNGFTKFSTTFDGAGHMVKIIEQIVLGNAVKIDAFIEKKDFEGKPPRRTNNYQNSGNYQNNEYNKTPRDQSKPREYREPREPRESREPRRRYNKENEDEQF